MRPIILHTPVGVLYANRPDKNPRRLWRAKVAELQAEYYYARRMVEGRGDAWRALIGRAANEPPSSRKMFLVGEQYRKYVRKLLRASDEMMLTLDGAADVYIAEELSESAPREAHPLEIISWLDQREEMEGTMLVVLGDGHHRSAWRSVLAGAAIALAKRLLGEPPRSARQESA